MATVRFRRRHILLRFCYLGWDYQGLASQEDTARTIEAELFRCLQLTRLVRDRQTANYHRCGRTDKVTSCRIQYGLVTVWAWVCACLPASLPVCHRAVTLTHVLRRPLCRATGPACVTRPLLTTRACRPSVR